MRGRRRFSDIFCDCPAIAVGTLAQSAASCALPSYDDSIDAASLAQENGTRVEGASQTSWLTPPGAQSCTPHDSIFISLIHSSVGPTAEAVHQAS